MRVPEISEIHEFLLTGKRMGSLERGESDMMNFHSKKTKKTFAAVIVILLVVSMVLPVIIGALSM